MYIFAKTRVDAINQYCEMNPGYHIDPLFGVLYHDDIRYDKIYSELKARGYKPRKTWYMDRGYNFGAMTIDADRGSARQQVEEVIDFIESRYDGLSVKNITKHYGKDCVKAKFEIRDIGALISDSQF